MMDQITRKVVSLSGIDTFVNVTIALQEETQAGIHITDCCLKLKAL